MVKYLSDNRADQRFQTILSRPQPFQAEVPEQGYAVDEVDLTHALDVVDAGARAYYANQEQELERESTAISYDTYQANRAAQQARQEKDNAEKQLVNTMKNDLYGKLNKIADFASQGGDPDIVERLTRETVMQQLKYSGAYLNADDATKVVKDLGLNITGDLLRNRINLEAEAEKQAIKDYRDTISGWADDQYGKEFAASLTMNEKENAYYQYTLADQNFMDANVIDFNEESTQELPAGNTRVSINTKMSASKWAEQEFKKALLQRMSTIPGDFRPTQEDINAELDRVATEIVNKSGGRIDAGTALMLARKGAVMSSYIPSSNLRSAQLKAQAEDVTHVQTIERAPAERVQARNDFQKQLLTQTLMQSAPISLTIAVPQFANTLYEENADFAQALDADLASLNFTGKTTGVDAGTKFVEFIDKALENPANAPAAYTTANSIRRWAASAFAEGDKYTYWDRAAALSAAQNNLTVLNGGEGPNTPGARIKADNGEQNTDWYRQFVDSGEMKYLPKDKRDQLFRDVYQKNRDRNTNLYLNDILGESSPFRNNIRYDQKTNKLVAVNIADVAAFERAGQLKLYKELDKLNQYFNDGKYSEYQGVETAEDFKNAVLKYYDIQNVSDRDIIHQRSNVYNLMEAINTGNTATAFKETPGAVADVLTGTLETLKEGAEYIVGKNVENYLDLQKATEGMSKEEQHNAIVDAIVDVENRTKNFLASLRGESVNKPETPGEEIARLEKETQEALEYQERMTDAYRTVQDNYTGNIDIASLPIVNGNSTVKSFSVRIGGKEVLLPSIVNGKEVSQSQAIKEYNRTGRSLGSYDTVEEADTVAKAISDIGEAQVNYMQLVSQEIKNKTGVDYTGNVVDPLTTIANVTEITPIGMESDLQYVRHKGKYYLEAVPGGNDREAKEYLKETGSYLGVANTLEDIGKQAEALMDATWGLKKSQETGEDKTKVQGAVSVFDAQGSQVGRTAVKDTVTGDILRVNK